MKKNMFSKAVLSLALALMMIFSSAAPALNVNVLPELVASAASTKKVSKLKITVASSVVYTGKALKPKVTVKDGSKTLKEGTHYTLKYSSNKNIGTGTVTVTGISKKGYTSSKKLSFKIVPGKPVVKVKDETTGTITLSWNKVAGAKKYIVYSYSTSTKKYTKLKSTSSTTYKKEGLSAGKTYYFAVKAYTTVNGKNVYSDLSSRISGATVPSKVKGLSATATDKSIKLSWSKTTGATGYKIYMYNTNDKKYIYLDSTKKTSITLEDVAAGCEYSLCVAAYKKADNGTLNGSKSSKLKISTPNADVEAYLDSFQSLIRKGTFTIKYKLSGLDTDMPFTVSVKGDKVAMVSSMSMSQVDPSMSGTIDMKMVYQGADKKAYMLIPDMKMYLELKGSDKENISPNVQKTMFAPEMKKDGIKITGLVYSSSVPYNCVSYPVKNGTVVYYLQGGKVKKINVVSGGEQNVLFIDSYSSSVNSDVFKVPSLTFWMNMDIFM